MHRNWMMKRSLSSRISDGWIEAKHERAIKLGAKRGKLGVRVEVVFSCLLQSQRNTKTL